MTSVEAQNSFGQKPLNAAESNIFSARKKLILTLIFTVISLFLLGIQLMPYVYGGSLGHFHSNGMCGWPNDCSKISSFPAF